MADFTKIIQTNIKLINSELDQRMPLEETRPRDLHKAMRYSIFAGGKRLRPLLCLSACEAAGGFSQAGLMPAIALEALHTYTLIHDDLPCMDDDDMRRGKPTCHKVFGEAMALLAGDALLTLSFEWLAETKAPPPYNSCELAKELAFAAGSRGVIGGQAEDIISEGAAPNADQVEYIHAHKTGALIRAAVRMGGIAAGASKEILQALTIYGEKIGLAFQIVDDILNETSTAEELGKASGSDRSRGKMTYVAVHGLNAAKAESEKLSRDAIEELSIIGDKAGMLVFIAETMMNRKN